MAKFKGMKFTFLNYLLSAILFCAMLIGGDEGYFGGWPTNQDKDQIKDPGFAPNCDQSNDKQEVGCACLENEDCYKDDGFYLHFSN